MTINLQAVHYSKLTCWFYKGFTPWVWKYLGRTSVNKHSSLVDTQIQVKTTILPQTSQLLRVWGTEEKKNSSGLAGFPASSCIVVMAGGVSSEPEGKKKTGYRGKVQRSATVKLFSRKLETTHMYDNNKTSTSGTSKTMWAHNLHNSV